ncbi:MAG: LamG domain-containing protein [Bacteroidota bacterium]
MEWLILFIGFYLYVDYTPAHSSQLENGLVAYYSFNACDARDDSGNGSNGTMHGRVQCWCGIEDDGLLFDGRQGYVQFEGIVNAYFSTSDLTVSFYIKPESRSPFKQSLLSKRDACHLEHAFDLFLNYSQKEITTIFHESEDKYFKNLAPAVEELGWMHVAIVREGASAASYINGQLHRRSFKCSGVDISNAADLIFGKSPCVEEGRARPFKGVLDELRVYDRALDEEEILQLYQQYPVEHAMVDCVT